ncbi:phage tail protein [Solirubrobacter soli]|uniref:phage tail protein n=1 Tax=Solirubrobacter soli TaxID=363832 RepID=UPI00040EE2B8|nr:phage tail protein [Solirubrobacter soli]
MPTTGERVDPYRGFNFAVEIDNTNVAGFRESSGLTFTTDPIEYREGNSTQLHVLKLPGLTKYGNIQLRRGFTQNLELWNWYLTVVNGAPERKAGAIVLRDEEQQPVVRWRFVEGWVCKWEGPAMNATTNEVAIESIEICVERVDIVPV